LIGLSGVAKQCSRIAAGPTLFQQPDTSSIEYQKRILPYVRAVKWRPIKTPLRKRHECGLGGKY